MPRNASAPAARFSIAPMMDWTDRHCRVFHRGLTRHALLYTEMITAAAIRHGDRQRLLGFSDIEHPVALQIGGSDPDEMALAAEMAEAFGYDEVNINVGCPSDRVQSGRFGACLMAEPEIVAASVAAMVRACGLPVTVKIRIGTDDRTGTRICTASSRRWRPRDAAPSSSTPARPGSAASARGRTARCPARR